MAPSSTPRTNSRANSTATSRPGRRRAPRPAPGGWRALMALVLLVSGLAAGAPAATATPVERVGGTDRIDTAIQVARRYASRFATGTAILARSDAYPDSLTATPLAAALDAPLYLTPPGPLDARVLTALRETGVRNVVLVGGSNAMAPRLEETLADSGMTTRRIAGRDRYGTALRLATAVRERLGTTSAPAVVATGTGFADALAAGPLAVRLGGVVLLSRGDTLDAATSSMLSGPTTRRVVAVGGPAAAATQAEGLTGTSYVGSNRYETAAKVAHESGSPSIVVLASGETFADALAGGVLAAQVNAPLLLSRAMTLSDATARFLRATSPKIVPVGGPQALSPAVLTAAELDAAERTSPTLPSPLPAPPAPPAPPAVLDAATVYAQARAKALAATSVRLTVTGLSCGGNAARATIEGRLSPGSLYAPPQRTRITLEGATAPYEIISASDPADNPWVYFRPPSEGWYGPFPAFLLDTGIPTLQTAVDALLAEVGLAGSSLVSAAPGSGGVLLTAKNGLTLTVAEDGLPTTATSGGATLSFSDWSEVAPVTIPQTAERALPTSAPSAPPTCAMPLP